MKRFITALAITLSVTGTAMAQSTQSTPRVYLGGNLGMGGVHLDDRAQYTAGVVAGYNLNRFVAVEGNVNFHVNNDHVRDDGQTAFANLVAGYPVGRTTPYVLAGVGAGFNGAGDSNNDPQALWNVGGGVAYRLTNNWSVDARYRYVDAWSGTRDAEHMLSLGVNYRF
jgi:opacity protein-like surface antigen